MMADTQTAAKYVWQSQGVYEAAQSSIGRETIAAKLNAHATLLAENAKLREALTAVTDMLEFRAYDVDQRKAGIAAARTALGGE